MPLYHVSTSTFEAGTILKPGRWGEVVRQFGKHGRALVDVGDAQNLAWEAVLEAARRASAPDAPSRLSCVFTCETLAAAEAFRNAFRSGATMYEVEKVDSASPTYVADYDSITGANDRPIVDFWVECALKYWTAKPTGIAEVLVGGEVKIIRPVQSSASKKPK